MRNQTLSTCVMEDIAKSAQSMHPEDKLIVALDVSSAAEALHLSGLLSGRCRWLKVGMELFYAEGRDLILRLQEQGFCIFLDLKLHDIPNTVAAAIRSLANLQVQILTLHAAGGPVMMAAAAAEVKLMEQPPLLAGVTVLTSMDQPQLLSLGLQVSPEEQVLRLATLAMDSGLRGLISSPQEVASLRQRFGPDPVLIVPGVRALGSALDDQRRTATPGEAIRQGASLLVVGRPITRAVDPQRAAEAILVEIDSELNDKPR